MTTIENQYRPTFVFHPGITIGEKLDELNMGPKEFAIRTGKPEKTIIAILNGNSSITPEMAVQFEYVLKIPAHYWLNLQRHYDEFNVREELRSHLTENYNWASKFPIAELVKKGWIPFCKTKEEKVVAMLNFFEFSSPKAWENYYFNQQLKVAFKISLANLKSPYAISAWLRQGQIQASRLEAQPFNEKQFKNSIVKIKNIIYHHPKDLFQQLQAVCLDAGVKLVYTPCISKAPISGCTRWLNDTPLIQLSGRFQRNDSFWFTFFHEMGHILLHGKKDIFLEDMSYTEKDLVKEEEANEFASKQLLSKEVEKAIVNRMPINEKELLELAEFFNTHPAIIIGRLQHLNILPYTFGRKYLLPIAIETD